MGVGLLIIYCELSCHSGDLGVQENLTILLPFSFRASWNVAFLHELVVDMPTSSFLIALCISKRLATVFLYRIDELESPPFLRTRMSPSI